MLNSVHAYIFRRKRWQLCVNEAGRNRLFDEFMEKV